MSERANRRLAAIVAADVAGFSRLVGADEEGTLARLRAHRRELIDPALAQHGGRLVNTAGDSLLLEFPSVVDALRCAIEVQAGMEERNSDLPEEHRILFRVGLNLGDVIAEGDDLLGDGVNVAARLEGLAEPGGIVLSRAARDQVRDRVSAVFDDLGEVEVKNIARPIHVFRMIRERELAPIRTSPAADDPIVALPSGPRLVVLPFDNLSSDSEQDFFVDGLTEDLTTRLAQYRYLFVIARNSAFKYKGRSPDVRDVGKDLAADYAVKGSIQRSGDRVRVNAQLLNAQDGTLIWAQRYDRELNVECIFGIQDALSIGISEAIAGARGHVARHTLKRVRKKPPNELASFECVLLAHRFYETFDPSTHARARAGLEAALERDPDYAEGWAALALMYRAELSYGVNARQLPLKRAAAAIERAIEIDQDNSYVHFAHARVRFDLGQAEEARSAIERALELDPNLPNLLFWAADTLIL